MTILASDFQNEIIRSAGYDPVEVDTFDVEASTGDFAYMALRDAVDVLTLACLDHRWNEPPTSFTLAADGNNVNIPAGVNPNFIHRIELTNGTYNNKILLRTNETKFAEQIRQWLTGNESSAPPTRWYTFNGKIYFNPSADIEYAGVIYGQQLPQEWAASDSSETELVITPEVRYTLKRMALWRFKQLQGGSDYIKIQIEAEGTPEVPGSDKKSLLANLIHGNKLTEKKKQMRMRLSKTITRLDRYT